MLQLIIIYQQFVYEHEGLLHYCPAALESLSVLPPADAAASVAPLPAPSLALACLAEPAAYLRPGAALATPGTAITLWVRVTVGTLLADSLQQLSVFPFHHLSVFPLSSYHLSVHHLSSYHLSVFPASVQQISVLLHFC